MSITQLISHARDLGAELAVRGDNLAVRSRRVPLPPELKAELSSRKPEVIAALVAEGNQAAHRPRAIPAERLARAAKGDALRASGQAVPLCWLPAPQDRVVMPPMPGKPTGGKLWFE